MWPDCQLRENTEGGVIWYIGWSHLIQRVELSENSARGCNDSIHTLGNCMGQTFCFIPQKFLRKRQRDSLCIRRQLRNLSVSGPYLKSNSNKHAGKSALIRESFEFIMLIWLISMSLFLILFLLGRNNVYLFWLMNLPSLKESKRHYFLTNSCYPKKLPCFKTGIILLIRHGPI